MAESDKDLLARILDETRMPTGVKLVDFDVAVQELGLRRELINRGRRWENFKYDVKVHEVQRWVRRGAVVALRLIGKDAGHGRPGDYLLVLESTTSRFVGIHAGYGSPKTVDVTHEEGPWWDALAAEAPEIMSALQHLDATAQRAASERIALAEAQKKAARERELAIARRALEAPAPGMKATSKDRPPPNEGPPDHTKNGSAAPQTGCAVAALLLVGLPTVISVAILLAE